MQPFLVSPWPCFDPMAGFLLKHTSIFPCFFSRLLSSKIENLASWKGFIIAAWNTHLALASFIWFFFLSLLMRILVLLLLWMCSEHQITKRGIKNVFCLSKASAKGMMLRMHSPLLIDSLLRMTELCMKGSQSILHLHCGEQKVQQSVDWSPARIGFKWRVLMDVNKLLHLLPSCY